MRRCPNTLLRNIRIFPKRTIHPVKRTVRSARGKTRKKLAIALTHTNRAQSMQPQQCRILKNP